MTSCRTAARTPRASYTPRTFTAGCDTLACHGAAACSSVSSPRTYKRPHDTLLVIKTEDGKRIEATPEHPFWVEGRGFVAARRLARSDLLRAEDGRAAAITSITERKGRFTVYNLEVEGTHTYFAGEAGWWVHNNCTDDVLALHKQHGDGQGWRLDWDMPDGSFFHDVYRRGDHLYDGAHKDGLHIDDYVKWWETRYGPGSFHHDQFHYWGDGVMEVMPHIRDVEKWFEGGRIGPMP
jgi:hypothetical protein